MFHTYVLATSGKSIDFDRASFLMDRDLLEQAMKALHEEKTIAPGRDCNDDSPDKRAQWVWEIYCRLHRQKYGEYFVADANPEWDQ